MALGLYELINNINKQIKNICCKIENLTPGGAGSYKVYTALLTQSGTSAPTAVVLENTLNVNISNQYVTNGNYNIISDTPIFLSNKVFFVYPSVSTVNLGYRIKIIRVSNTAINFQVTDSGFAGVNSGITDHSIEIRVYN